MKLKWPNLVKEVKEANPMPLFYGVVCRRGIYGSVLAAPVPFNWFLRWTLYAIHFLRAKNESWWEEKLARMERYADNKWRGLHHGKKQQIYAEGYGDGIRDSNNVKVSETCKSLSTLRES